jgi:tRNA(adenine34) deaminase
MCLGAALQSRVSAIVYGAPDARLGAVDSHYYRQEIERVYRYFPVIQSGIMERESALLLKSFFSKVRDK